jgi:hypothetical protein
MTSFPALDRADAIGLVEKTVGPPGKVSRAGGLATRNETVGCGCRRPVSRSRQAGPAPCSQSDTNERSNGVNGESRLDMLPVEPRRPQSKALAEYSVELAGSNPQAFPLQNELFF